MLIYTSVHLAPVCAIGDIYVWELWTNVYEVPQGANWVRAIKSENFEKPIKKRGSWGSAPYRRTESRFQFIARNCIFMQFQLNQSQAQVWLTDNKIEN